MGDSGLIQMTSFVDAVGQALVASKGDLLAHRQLVEPIVIATGAPFQLLALSVVFQARQPLVQLFLEPISIILAPALFFVTLQLASIVLRFLIIQLRVFATPKKFVSPSLGVQILDEQGLLIILSKDVHAQPTQVSISLTQQPGLDAIFQLPVTQPKAISISRPLVEQQSRLVSTSQPLTVASRFVFGVQLQVPSTSTSQQPQHLVWPSPLRLAVPLAALSAAWQGVQLQPQPVSTTLALLPSQLHSSISCRPVLDSSRSPNTGPQSHAVASQCSCQSHGPA